MTSVTVSSRSAALVLASSQRSSGTRMVRCGVFGRLGTLDLRDRSVDAIPARGLVPVASRLSGLTGEVDEASIDVKDAHLTHHAQAGSVTQGADLAHQTFTLDDLGWDLFPVFGAPGVRPFHRRVLRAVDHAFLGPVQARHRAPAATHTARHATCAASRSRALRFMSSWIACSTHRFTSSLVTWFMSRSSLWVYIHSIGPVYVQSRARTDEFLGVR